MASGQWMIEIRRPNGWRKWSLVATEEEAKEDLGNLQRVNPYEQFRMRYVPEDEK